MQNKIVTTGIKLIKTKKIKKKEDEKNKEYVIE